MFDDEQLKRLLDYIITNREIDLYDSNGLFTRETLIHISDILSGRRENDFRIKKEQKKALIKKFLDNNSVISKYDPAIISSNEACILSSMEQNINSINYAIIKKDELKEKIKKYVLSNDYIICKDTPDFLKEDLLVIVNSIKLDVNSINKVPFSVIRSLSKDEFNYLVDLLISNSYLLSSESNYSFRCNPKIIMNSVKLDFNTSKYIDSETLINPEIFKFLLVNGYDFDEDDLLEASIKLFHDKDIMKYALIKDEKFSDEISPEDADKCFDRMATLLSKALDNYPTIDGIKALYDDSIESYWYELRELNPNLYSNVFAKICGELHASNYETAVLHLRDLMNEMKEILGDSRFDELIMAMREYSDAIHNAVDKDKLSKSRDSISRLSALYIAKSKELIKKENLEDYLSNIEEYFELDDENPFVKKRIYERIKIEDLRAYCEYDYTAICKISDKIVEKYHGECPDQEIRLMVKSFIVDRLSRLDLFIKAPSGYTNYKRYLEAKKLINRLNAGYIKYDDLDVYNYMDIIGYDDEVNGVYYYTGPVYGEDRVARFKAYKAKQDLFKKIKKDIMNEAFNLKFDPELQSTIDEMVEDYLSRTHASINVGEIKFSDKFYKFSVDENETNYEDLVSNVFLDNIQFNVLDLLDDKIYEHLKKVVVDSSIVWTLLVTGNDEDAKQFTSIILNIEDIITTAKQLNIKLEKYADYKKVNKLLSYADAESIAILGEDLVSILATEIEYTDSEDSENIIKMNKELVCKKALRKEFTIPFVSGQTENYKYETYDIFDNSLLISGYETDSCFHVDGADNDFFHYASLDKNGVIIKITDSNGNFVARAAGFRNGNCVYFNQLRTVFDEGGNYYKGNLSNETKEIIDVFTKACEDIVKKSQEYDVEKDKIDHIFITRSYIFETLNSNVPEHVYKYISCTPMDNKSKDWERFVNNTKNLKESSRRGRFTTDYGQYLLICTASTKDPMELRREDIISKNVDAVYQRDRKHITVCKGTDNDIFREVNKIAAMNSYLSNTEYEPVSVPEDSLVFYGDNWFIVYTKDKIYGTSVSGDSSASIEYDSTLKVLRDFAIRKATFTIEEITSLLGRDDLKLILNPKKETNK